MLKKIRMIKNGENKWEKERRAKHKSNTREMAVIVKFKQPGLGAAQRAKEAGSEAADDGTRGKNGL